MTEITRPPIVKCDNCGVEAESHRYGAASDGWTPPREWGKCEITQWDENGEELAGEKFDDLCPYCLDAVFGGVFDRLDAEKAKRKAA